MCFDTRNIEQYDCGAVEVELVQLFPDVAHKGLKFDLCHVDDLAGEVSDCCCDSNLYKVMQCGCIFRRWQLKAMEISELH